MPASVDALQVKVRTGRGSAVLVEGETDRDDPFLYGRWFGDRATTFAFFPSDGWDKVTSAVGELRQREPHVALYGIVDRDFADDHVVEAQYAGIPENGVLRLPRYTLENYLLDPGCWFSVLGLVFAREGSPPEGWDSPDAIARQIESAYRDCAVVSAHNRVIKFGNGRYRSAAEKTPDAERQYVRVLEALRQRDPRAKLAAWGQSLGAGEDFGQLFDRHFAELQDADLDCLAKRVSGKVVLKHLHRQFPNPPRGGQFGVEHYLNLYLDKCPEPSEDLQELLQLIQDDVGR